MNRSLLMASSAVVLLVGCQAIPGESTDSFIPTNCEIPKVLSAFQQSITGALFIPTDWQPAEDTDLFEVYELGGIACTYGIESAEIGGTLMWAKVSDDFWRQKVDKWETLGYLKVDVPELNESDAFALSTTAADDVPVWLINLELDGVWIQFGASKFVASLDDARAILKAAASAIEAERP